MAHDVFISYSTKNKSVADAVCDALENAAIRCWLAPRDVQPGRSFAGEITRAIHGSKAMVLIFSADSNKSEQILRELELAANTRLHIIQFRIEDVTPNDDLQYYLSTPHWLDATAAPLEKHLGRLANALKTLLETSEKEREKSGREIPLPLAESRAEGSEKPKQREPGATIAAPPGPAEKIPETSGGSIAPSSEAEAPIDREISISRRKKIPVWVWLACVAMLLLCSIPFILKKLSHPVAKGPSRTDLHEGGPNLFAEFGDLIIETDPIGAAVTLDKSPPTTAPHTFKNVTFGTHRLTVTLDGYLPVEHELRFDGANPPKIVLQPKPRPPEEIAKLSVRSNPPGALIRLDGAPPPQPPNTFINVKFGKHKLTASLDGYEPKEKDLIVDRGTATDIILQLDRIKPTPAPSPTPDSVIALLDEVKGYEAAQDWLKYHRASLSLVQRLTTSGEPASAKHKEALQVVMEGLRTKGPALNSNEFTAYEENIKYAAHLDIMPAILILADHLKIKNSPEAFNWYYYAGETRRSPDAMTMLGWLYYRGDCGLRPDRETAFKWFKLAYENGSTAAGTVVGDCYLRGDGTAKDQDAGIRILLQLANAGVPHAKTLIGQSYYDGFGHFGKLGQGERDQKAKAYYEQAIAAGDWVAYGHLGVLYEVGRGVPKDWKQAVKLYLQGVDRKDPICMYYYARALEEHGAEITRIFGRRDKAETYYKKAAAASVTPAKDWCVEHNVKFQ
jgi:TPR repeat protein